MIGCYDGNIVKLIMLLLFIKWCLVLRIFFKVIFCKIFGKLKIVLFCLKVLYCVVINLREFMLLKNFLNIFFFIIFK